MLNPRTSWASRDGQAAKRQRAAEGAGYGEGSGDDAEAEEVEAGGAEALLSQAGGLMGPTRGSGRGGRLAPGHLETSRMKDANQHEPHDSVVRSVEFHPGGQLLMTAGLDKKIRIFQVRGRVWGPSAGGSPSSLDQ